ncbi:hypothetical protein V1282_003953 [Nitrobacteraceae bacterium AZCC 2146]
MRSKTADEILAHPRFADARRARYPIYAVENFYVIEIVDIELSSDVTRRALAGVAAGDVEELAFECRGEKGR